MSAAPQLAGLQASEAETAALYRRYEGRLRAWLGARVSAPPALLDDACAGAWLILLVAEPERGEHILGWLRTTALHEAYRLLRLQRREPAAELADDRPAFVPEGRDDLETALEARRALRALASLGERQRRYRAWQLGGHSYREIQALAGGATYTNVNKHLTRAREGLRQLADQECHAHAAGRHQRGGGPVSIGICSRCRTRPRRVRRGVQDVLCEQCYEAAMAKVARELAEEAAEDGRERYRRFRLKGSAFGHPPRPAARGPRCIDEGVLAEARRLYERGQPMHAVAETLLKRTSYASAHSAEVALRAQFKRRGWALRTRAEAQAVSRAAARRGNSRESEPSAAA